MGSDARHVSGPDKSGSASVVGLEGRIMSDILHAFDSKVIAVARLFKCQCQLVVGNVYEKLNILLRKPVS